MFDWESVFNTAKVDTAPWFDLEFLASKELDDFYRNWKEKQIQQKQDAKLSAEKEARRKQYEALKREFE